MTSGTQESAHTLQHRDGVRTICQGCGATAPGIHPAGWLVFARYGTVGTVKAVVGEIPFCSDCRRECKIHWPSNA